MIYSDTRSRNRRHKLTPCFQRQFLVHVSCMSGTGFVWYQILVAIRTLFCAPSQKWHTHDWNDDLCLVDDNCLRLNLFSCCNLITSYEFIVDVTFSRVYFRCPKFSFQMHIGTKNGSRKMESIYGAGFWSVCYGYTAWVISKWQILLSLVLVLNRVALRTGSVADWWTFCVSHSAGLSSILQCRVWTLCEWISASV